MKEKGRKEKVNKIELLRHDIFIHALVVKQTLTLFFTLLLLLLLVYYVQRVWGEIIKILQRKLAEGKKEKIITKKWKSEI